MPQEFPNRRQQYYADQVTDYVVNTMPRGQYVSADEVCMATGLSYQAVLLGVHWARRNLLVNHKLALTTKKGPWGGYRVADNKVEVERAIQALLGEEWTRIQVMQSTFQAAKASTRSVKFKGQIGEVLKSLGHAQDNLESALKSQNIYVGQARVEHEKDMAEAAGGAP